MTRYGLSLVIAAVLLQAPAARGAQLDKDACAKLKSEQVLLEQGGTRASLGKGPEWGKANLAPDKIEQIRRLIEVDEQLLFRCGGRPLVVLPADPDPAAREVESKDGAKVAPAKGTKTPDAAKKAPDAEKKKAAPLKKAGVPPVDPPAKSAPSEPPAANTVPPPETAPAAAKEAAKEAAPATLPPPGASPVPVTLPPRPAKEAEDKKAAAAKAAKAKANAKKKPDDAYRPPVTDSGSNPFAGQLAPPAKK